MPDIVRKSSSVFGWALVIIGTLFLLDNLGYIDAGWIVDKFWPLLLVIAGIVALARKSGSGGSSQPRSPIAPISPVEPSEGATNDYLNQTSVFGSVRRQIQSRQFRGGNCSVVFGDIRLDLTDAALSTGEQVLHLTSTFGSIRLTIPETMEYSVRANLVAGSISIKGERRGGLFQTVSVRSDRFITAEQRLVIEASSTFGDIRIL